MERNLDIQEILKTLPHRYPFVLIDAVLDLVPGERIVALKNVTFNEPFFAGHFPEHPVMPGVLIIEGMAQAGGVLAFASASEEIRGSLVYFIGMDRIRFRRPVTPGDQLVFRVEFLKKSSWAVKFAGLASVDEERAAEAEFTATLPREAGKALFR